jgi:hypothetical protein
VGITSVVYNSEILAAIVSSTPFKIDSRIGIPESENRDATHGKPSIAPRISIPRLDVLTAIEFHRQTRRRTVEIKNERTGRVLPAKIDAKLSIAKPLPQLHFDIGRVATHLSGARCLESGEIKSRLLDPHPARFARRPPLFKGR